MLDYEAELRKAQQHLDAGFRVLYRLKKGKLLTPEQMTVLTKAFAEASIEVCKLSNRDVDGLLGLLDD